MREMQVKYYGSSVEKEITSGEEEQGNHYRKSGIWAGFKNKLSSLFIHFSINLV